jgi:hypothetical protein
VIVDWKTTRRRSSRVWLDKRLQTILYPLLLAESSKRLIGYQLKPEQVRLIYWFANAPAEIEVFQYSTARMEQDKQTLKILLDSFGAMSGEIWPLTPNTAFCRLCQYRSLCDRGREAGNYDEIDTDTPETVQVSAPDTPDDYVL